MCETLDLDRRSWMIALACGLASASLATPAVGQHPANVPGRRAQQPHLVPLSALWDRAETGGTTFHGSAPATIAGRVVLGTGTLSVSQLRAVVQSGGQGIQLWDSTRSVELVVGDSVRVSGVPSLYDGMLEISHPDVRWVATIRHVPDPIEARPVAAELEGHVGALVTVTGRVRLDAGHGAHGTVELVPEQGMRDPDVRVSVEQSPYGTVRLPLGRARTGDRLQVTGVVIRYTHATAPRTEYVIYPDAADRVRWIGLGGVTRDRVVLAGTGALLLLIALVIAGRLAYMRRLRQLRRAEARLRSMYAGAADAILMLDPVGHTIQEVNPAAVQLTGFGAAALTSRKFPSLFPPSACGEVARLIQEVHGHAVGEAVLEMADASGAPRTVVATLTLTEVERERRLIAVLRDVTDQRLMAASLTASEARYVAVSRATNDSVWDWDLAADTLQWNESVFTAFGYARDEPVGTIGWWVDHLHPGDRERVVHGIHAAIDGGATSWSDEYRFRRGDGSYATVFDRGYVLHDGAARPARMIGSMLDVTERRQLEAQLRQAQKMEAVGQLAGGIAHDFNNLLTVIQGSAEFVLESMPGTEPLRADIEEVHRAATRAASLTRQLLAFSRRQLLQPRTLDLNLVVEQIETLVRRLIGEDIDVSLQLAPGLGNIAADAGQIEQVLMNLVVNARDAMPHGGRLVISTRQVLRDQPPAAPGAGAGRYVVLRVRDTGCGMDAETRSRIFEPFFTTKEMGRGTGLGLSTAYGIVVQSGGWIEVESEPGRGSAFDVYLPEVSVPDASPAPAPAPAPAVGSGGDPAATILVVEDEAAVRAIARRVLQRQGYRVVEAANGVEGLRVVTTNGERLKLVLTDAVMPEMDGIAFGEALLVHRPDLPVLYMSGYTDDEIMRRGLGRPGAAFLPKPFTADELAQKVGAMLQLATV